MKNLEKKIMKKTLKELELEFDRYLNGYYQQLGNEFISLELMKLHNESELISDSKYYNLYEKELKNFIELSTEIENNC